MSIPWESRGGSEATHPPSRGWRRSPGPGAEVVGPRAQGGGPPGGSGGKCREQRSPAGDRVLGPERPETRADRQRLKSLIASSVGSLGPGERGEEDDGCLPRRWPPSLASPAGPATPSLTWACGRLRPRLAGDTFIIPRFEAEFFCLFVFGF